MRGKNLPVLVLGVVLLGFFVVRCSQPMVPVIQFIAPTGSTPIVAETDPLDAPQTVDVEIAFPPTVNPCAGMTYPVFPETLSLSLQQMDDTQVVQEWPIDASGWWNETQDRIQGQITIGGETSGQSWAAYRIKATISNAQGPVEASVSLRVEKPIEQLTGGWYDVKVVSIRQTPENCILPQIALGVVHDIMAQYPPLQVQIPAGSEYPDAITFPLPDPIGPLTLYAVLDVTSNDIVFPDPVTLAGIDLGPYNIPGFNCLVGGSGDGWVDGEVDPEDMDATIRIFDMSVSTGSGSGSCNLSPPSEDCVLWVTLDGNAY